MALSNRFAKHLTAERVVVGEAMAFSNRFEKPLEEEEAGAVGVVQQQALPAFHPRLQLVLLSRTPRVSLVTMMVAAGAAGAVSKAHHCHEVSRVVAAAVGVAVAGPPSCRPGRQRAQEHNTNLQQGHSGS